MATGVYHLDNVGFTGVSVVTNTVSTTAYRGAGRPEAAVAIERMVDRFAAEIGVDPAEVRRRNYVPRFTEPYTTGIGTEYDVGDYPASLRRALDVVGYDELRAEQAARRERRRPTAARHRTRHLRRGHRRRADARAGRCRARRRRRPDRAQRSDAVRPRPRHDVGDDRRRRHRSGAGPDPRRPRRHRRGPPPVDSRSALVLCSSAERRSPVPLRGSSTLARARVADRFEAHVADVVLDVDAGQFHIAGTPAQPIGWAELVDGDPLTAEFEFTPPMPTYPFGTHVAVVEVDTETGHVTLAAPRRRRRRRHADQPVVGRRAGARRHRPRRGPGTARRASTTTPTASRRRPTSPTIR